jgi:cytidyltransferase-like protein
MQIAPVSEVQIRSTARPYDLAVLIGRFQPFHKGHLSVVRNALAHAEKVLILVGSANRARDTYNPFIYRERQKLIFDVLQGEHDLWPRAIGALDAIGQGLHRPHPGRPLDDTPTTSRLDQRGQHGRARRHPALRPRICLTGNIRDATSEYLTWFPAWDYLPAPDTGSTPPRSGPPTSTATSTSRTRLERSGPDLAQVCPPSDDRFPRPVPPARIPYLMKQQAKRRPTAKSGARGRSRPSIR